MGTFGVEFLNVLRSDELEQPLATTREVLQSLIEGLASAQPSYIYFAPRAYEINVELLNSLSSISPEVILTESGAPRGIIVPERHTLWFARGAFLELGPGVVVVIRGQIRAEATKIFSLPDVRELWSLGTTAYSVEDPATPAASAAVRIESRRMEEIRPEWFDARTEGGVAVGNGSANARAMQACLDAACRDRVRDGEPLLPLTVVCQGVYAFSDTLRATAGASGRGALFMRGDGDVVGRNLGFGLVRLPRTYVRLRSGTTTIPAPPEDHRSALLRVESGVSLEVEGVGFKVEPVPTARLSGGELSRAGDALDVRHAVLIEEDPRSRLEPAWRFAFFDRSGIVGALHACVTLQYEEGSARAEPPGSALDRFSGELTAEALRAFAATDGTLVPEAKLVRANVSVPLRAPVAPLRLYAFRDTSMDASFVSGAPIRLSSHGLDVQLGEEAMVGIAGGRFSAKKRDFDGFVDHRAGVRLRGASLLIRGVSFHLSEGPHPSRTDWETSPDGQDVWLDARGSERPHLTMMHCDSQSWWLLGGLRARAAGAVCLLNVGAGDVNLLERGSETGLSSDRGEAMRFYRPPTLFWPGGPTPLLLEGCVFKRYALRLDPTDRIVNVGSTFFQSGASLASWFPARAVPAPGEWRGGRVIDPALRINHDLRPQELGLLEERAS